MIARLLKVLVCLLLFAVLAAAQQTQSKPSPSPSPDQPEDIIKVYTELRQTDVMVFDSKGQFVDGLTRENFELKIDGKPAPITFFERVEAGTGNEEAQWLAARDQRPAKPTAPTSYGRKVLFFVDDIHMSPASIVQARNLITKYLDYEQTEYDEAQIASASGNIGFFQQLTDNKTVLRHAVEKLTPYHRTGKDFEIPPMSSYHAFLIDRGDTNVLEYFVDELLKQNRLLTRPVATDLVRARANNIMRQASHWVLKTLGALDNVIRDSTNVPGRKVLFFISDGFLINSNYNDMSNAIRSLASDAARAGVVIYSIDARGLVPPAVDNNASADLSNRLVRSSQGEIFAFQDPLNSLAEDSGGRPLFNNNDLYVAVDRGLKETSFYYLLGWTPERTDDGPTKVRKLEVFVIGRPDLKVRVRKGAFTLDPAAAKTAKRSESEKTQTLVAKLQHALAASGPSREIPVSVALSYVDTPEKGPSLSVVMEIPIEALSSDVQAEKPSTSVDFAGAVFDREGKSTTTFGQNVKLAEALKRGGRKLTYTHTVFPRPGLYQVRVAARDALSGRVGTAKSWIQIPDLSAKKLTLSSLVVGERPSSNADVSAGPLFSNQVPLNVARRFKSDSFLRCLVFVYNATRTQPDRLTDIAIQVQVLRNNKPVITTPLKPVAAQSGHDHDRLPYATEVSLKGLAPGRYTLSITAIDRAAKTSASEQVRFDVQ
ncbi:MAG: VWA domain-containing protein [Acidobacteria bacterium]|nr:VWA domain-containing protein [Acidobacteriota bacterium]MCA1627812.1 VWA domain-containing protein [Acidobacteriota bacterium]